MKTLKTAKSAPIVYRQSFTQKLAFPVKPDAATRRNIVANGWKYNQQAIVTIMEEMNRERGMTFLFSTHDPLVMRHARRLVQLVDGRMVSDRPVTEVAS